MNIARARGLAEALLDYPADHNARYVGEQILAALAWTDDDDFAATQRVLGAMVGSYEADLNEETERQAQMLVFVAMASIGAGP